MDDKAQALDLYRKIKRKIGPFLNGKSNAAINAALSEITVDVALNGQVGKTRADAMEMLGTTMTLAARQARQ